MSTFTRHKSRSKTDSIESYDRAAKQTVCLLMNNKRRGKHLIVLHYLKVFTAQKINEIWRKLKNYLKKVGIVAFRSVEITRNKYGQPTDKIHYHFVIDSLLSEEKLRLLFRECCFCSGLMESEFRIDYKQVKSFLGIICYVTKYKRSDQVILFAKHTGIRKFETIGDWYLDESDNPINRKKAWEKIIERQKKRKEEQDTNHPGDGILPE